MEQYIIKSNHRAVAIPRTRRLLTKKHRDENFSALLFSLFFKALKAPFFERGATAAHSFYKGFSFKYSRRALVSPIVAVYTAPMFQVFPQRDAVAITDALLDWFSLHKRPLPWRQHYTPYEVWISEVMLQQTQMERGVSYFQRWMKRFPHVRAVAEAPEEEILRYWEGLGYYRRARFLHQAARVMLEQYGGNVPSTMDELSSLPGLGEYTVAAILGIAYGQDIVTIDANVERVFSRLLNIDTPVRKKPASSIIRQEALRFLPKGQARDYNQALMELGALVCGKSPRCSTCPLARWCVAHSLGLEKERPVAETRGSIIPVTSVHAVLLCEKQVLLFQRPSSGLWGNMWEFPGTEVKDLSEQETLLRHLEHLGISVDIIAPLGHVRHGYTNHKLTAHFFRVATEPPLDIKEISLRLGSAPHRFLPWTEIGNVAMPAHHRKMADRYFLKKRRPTAEQLPL